MHDKAWIWDDGEYEVNGPSKRAFYAVSRLLLKSAAAGVNHCFLDDDRWRHHGLGMLQRELDDSTRIHVWHPSLRVPWADGFRAVHDHRFDFASAVMSGSLDDVPHDVIQEGSKHYLTRSGGVLHPSEGWRGCPETELFEIAHAKLQMKGDTHKRHLGKVFVRKLPPRTRTAGDVYEVRRRLFHTTIAQRLAVTVVSRSNFDEHPARVLDNPESGIVPKTDATSRLRWKVLEEAARAIASQAFAE